MKKNIAVITGGDSSEEVISVQSASFIISNIDSSVFNVFLVYIGGKDWHVIDGEQKLTIDKNYFSFFNGEEMIKFDGAYLIIHGPPAENGKLQGYLEMMGLPYVGPGVMQAALTFNKEITKQFLATLGINSSPAVILNGHDDLGTKQIIDKIGFPCFVKPNCAGSSFGVTKVYKEKQLKEAISNALTEDGEVMVEKFMKGIELTCGVYSLNGESVVLPVTEIVSSKDFFDFEAKYTPGVTDEITPARIANSHFTKCQELTKLIFDELNLTGISRIDYILMDNELYLLEVNTIPGMSAESIVPKQIIEAGLEPKELLTNMVKAIF